MPKDYLISYTLIHTLHIVPVPIFLAKTLMIERPFIKYTHIKFFDPDTLLCELEFMYTIISIISDSDSAVTHTTTIF